MKKLFSLLVWLLMFWTWAYAQDIQLKPGWTAVSTPVVLESLSFSNGWEWISFVTVNGWNWETVPATVNNIKPLNGFMVYNTNSSTVTLTLDYKDNPTPAESLLQKTLNPWWNLIWVVWTEDPFSDIDAKVFVDPNGIWKWKASKTISNVKLGWAYFVFVNSQSIYLWVNYNWEEEDAWSIQEQIVEVPVSVLSDKAIDWYRIVLDWKFNLLAKFKVRSSSTDELSKLTSFTLKSNIQNNLIDKQKINVFVWWYEIDNDNITINNDWDIIVQWLDKNLSSFAIPVEVEYEWHFGNCILDYTLTKVNWQTYNMNFKQRLVWIYAIPYRSTNLNDWTTMVDFQLWHDELHTAITWVVMFAWNKALNEPEDFENVTHSVIISNWEQPQIVDGIWFWCPINPTSINDCNEKILKSEFRYLFTDWWKDLQIF